MGNYIPFTEQQREDARRTDLAAFLRQQGEQVKRSGTEFDRLSGPPFFPAARCLV